MNNNISTKLLPGANITSPRSQLISEVITLIVSNIISQMDISQLFPMNRRMTSIRCFLLTLPFISNTNVMDDFMTTEEVMIH